jgi:hypothetical protein
MPVEYIGEGEKGKHYTRVYNILTKEITSVPWLCHAPENMLPDYSPTGHGDPSTPASLHWDNSRVILSARSSLVHAILLNIRLFLSFHSIHQVRRARDRHRTAITLGTIVAQCSHQSSSLVVSVVGARVIGRCNLASNLGHTPMEKEQAAEI